MESGPVVTPPTAGIGTESGAASRPGVKAKGTLGQGRARLSVAQRDGRSFLDQRYYTDPYRLFTPQVAPGEPVSIVTSTLSGGLTGGDHLSFEARVEAGAAAQFVGQAAEKLYRSAGPETRVDFKLSAERGSWLELVPQETILFDGSRLDRRFDIDLESGAQALIGDMVVLGRLAMGEAFTTGSFADSWRLSLDGRLIWADRLGFADAADIESARAHRFGLDAATAFATILVVGEGAAAAAVDLARQEALVERASAHDIRLGATCLGPHSLIRLMGPQPQPLRGLLGDIWKQLRAQGGGFAPSLPALWSI